VVDRPSRHRAFEPVAVTKFASFVKGIVRLRRDEVSPVATRSTAQL
jgi:hypothetical protein